jgi:hypothetical protein
MTVNIDVTLAKWYFQDQTKSKTHQNTKMNPTWNTIVMFNPPNGQDMVIFFLNLLGYHVMN